MLYVCEFSPQQARIPVAASSREQSAILYEQAERFVLDNPRLHEQVHSDIASRRGKLKTLVPRFRALSGYRRIEHVSGSVIQMFAADDRTGDGVLFTMGILDELHRHRDLNLYRTWTGKRLKRGGQIVAISTAGEPGSEFEETREAIRQMAPEVTRTGCHVRAAGPSLVLHEWAVPEGGDVEDIKLVKAANPLAAITVAMLRKKRDSPTMTLSHWRRFTCNVATRSEAAAITEAEWEAAKTDERIPEGDPIWLGLDVAWKFDTTSAVPFWTRPLAVDELQEGEQAGEASAHFRLLGPATVLVPPRNGNPLDPDLIEHALMTIHVRNPVHTVVMDTTRAEQLGAWIERTLGATVVDRQQTNTQMASDCEAFMEGLRTGRLHHTGDSSLSQHALNAVAHQLPDERLKFERPRSSRAGGEQLQRRRVIDALVAAAMVHRTWLENAGPEPEPLVAWR